MKDKPIWIIVCLVIVGGIFSLMSHLFDEGIAESGLVDSMTPTRICVSNPPPPKSRQRCYRIDEDTRIVNHPELGQIVTVHHKEGAATVIEADPNPPH
jgi:hypothetical protein